MCLTQLLAVQEHVKEMMTAYRKVVPYGSAPTEELNEKWFGAGGASEARRRSTGGRAGADGRGGHRRAAHGPRPRPRLRPWPRPRPRLRPPPRRAARPRLRGLSPGQLVGVEAEGSGRLVRVAPERLGGASRTGWAGKSSP